jgi:hypothetical protein
VEQKLNRYLHVSYLQLLLSAILVIVTTMGILLFWNSTNKAEQILTERVKLREFILARAGALAISDFFEARKTKLLILASSQEIKSNDKEKSLETAQKVIQEMKERPITAIGFLDKEGKIFWSETYPKLPMEEGMDASDRSHFLWAKSQTKEGAVFVSEPVIARTGPSKGSWIVIMATPLFNNNQFNGALYMVITIKDLMDKFVTPLTVSPMSTQMIIDKDGTVVASTIAESTGMNILKDKETKGLSDLAKKTLVDQEGSLVTELTYPGGKPMKIITGYAPIKTEVLSWFLYVSVPYKEVKDQLNPFSTIQNEGLILLFVGLIVLILFDVLIMRIAERQGYRKGYSKCLIENKKPK